MAWIVQSLNEEWATVASSPAARRALMRWTSRNPASATAHSVDDFVDTRTRPRWGDQALRVLAAEAPDDEIAARTLLQALLGGLVRLATQVAHDDPDAVGEVVSMAWNRIRTYPSQRCGPVAGNVLLDVRKELLRTRVDGLATPNDEAVSRGSVDPAQTPEEVVVEKAVIEELFAARDRGLVSGAALATIFRTRVGGESLVEVAADMDMSADAMWRRRTRAERRLRLLPLAS
ncbi:hypothetical protein HC251_04530 [Iamia sp. SCSIO 61187]|uniref:hypothetical protein n=1 Tax=Iamia sp. SCSIO 61187 TaxID=2722752 RepID=UPI001C62D407|nr:hypothetical protein [Iamia sp. SCSIO 61187]QYG91776.1 hypothetical protein HC251_04530 [Iamia sp. SCSIO 61187]